jgi:hypothetical protein
MIRTFVDSCVLIGLGRLKEADRPLVMPLMYDPERQFVVSPFVELEVIPTPLRAGYLDQVRFYREFFTAADSVDPRRIIEETLEVLLETSMPLADALHVGAASAAGCHELVTIEGARRAMHKNRRVKVVSIGR